MTESKNTAFRYQGRDIHFELLSECSVSRHLSTTGTFYELPFLEAIGRILPADTAAFDVGAHIGNHTVYFAKVLGWRVFAFEPNPDAFEKLTANVERNGLADKVTCFQVALADVPGTVRMARTEPSDVGTVAVVTGDAPPGNYVEVEAATLDSYAHLAEPGPTLLKIDVEGYEPNVIEGGRDFLSQIAPHMTTEVQSISEFDGLYETLRKSHRPSGIFNPTPTVLWAPSTTAEQHDSSADMIRYAIRAQMAYNAEHRRSLTARRSLETVESILEHTSESPPDSGRVGLERFRDQLAGSVEIQRLAGQRILVIAVGEYAVPVAALSAVVRGVDVAVIRDAGSRQVEVSRYVAGRLTESRLFASVGNDRLGAALIHLFIESGEQRMGLVTATVVVGGEAAPELVDTVVDLVGSPYIMVTEDPVYLPRRLRSIIGASACYVTSPNALEEWSARQIVSAGVLDPEDPMSMVGGLTRTLPKPGPRRDDGQEADHRLLLVSYYSRPAKTVAIQRLAYWKDHLPSIAASKGLALTVDWLSATSPDGLAGDSIYVPDRGPLHVPLPDWEKYRELQQLELDVTGASWSHYVRESARHMTETYDAVLISGNPFYYFDLAPFFRELWDARVVLDFRDPWARQERFRYSIEQRAKLIEIEERVVEEADAILSVNHECVDSIAPTVDVPRFVISNGFDDTVVDMVPAPDRSEADGLIKLVYAGTVYATQPLDKLLDALSEDRHRFVHFGRDYSKSQAARSHPAANTRGLVSYEELIAALKASDAGIITTTGEPSTSTTKIFDYVACDLDIIIVTLGRPRTGLLHQLTAELDGVYWVEDDPDELKKFFSSYEPGRRHRPNRLEFSRREQAVRLLDVLYESEAALT